MDRTRGRILLVEDDLNMGFLLVDFLESNNFSVKLCRDGESGLNAYNETDYDFCILDVMLPGIDGFTIAGKIRENNKRLPIIFLTARSMKADKLNGFKLGVDDYVTKPFDEDELLCRINAILNRAEWQEQSQREIESSFQIGKYTFDFANQALHFESEIRRLTQKESAVLNVLTKSKNQLIKRDDILMAVWGDADYFKGRSLDVFIVKLRKYLQGDPTIKIENVPLVGYVLSDSSM